MTNSCNVFKTVREWHKAFNITDGTVEMKEEYSKDELSLALKIIREEFLELERAIIGHNPTLDADVDYTSFVKKNMLPTIDLTEVADAIVDTIWTSAGLADRLGLEGERLFESVAKSNYSKLTTNELVAEESAHILRTEKGVETEVIRVTDLSKPEGEQQHFYVVNAETRKILKCLEFHEPEFYIPNKTFVEPV